MPGRPRRWWRRAFKVPNPVASTASDALEHCLVTTFEQSDIDAIMREVRDEFLRYSRGTARVRLSESRAGVPQIAYDHFHGVGLRP